MLSHSIILFDGVCNLCNSSVQFIIRNDKNSLFRFASLQSEVGQTYLVQHKLPLSAFESVLLIENDRLYQHSTAALRIARKLDGAWKFAYAFIIIPSFLRDPLYSLVARNRYKWFGKKDACMIPSPELKARFLDN